MHSLLGSSKCPAAIVKHNEEDPVRAEVVELFTLLSPIISQYDTSLEPSPW